MDRLLSAVAVGAGTPYPLLRILGILGEESAPFFALYASLVCWFCGMWFMVRTDREAARRRDAAPAVFE